MHKSFKILLGGIGLLAGSLLVVQTGGAAGEVKPTADNCANAHAALMSSHPSVHGGFAHPDYGDAIKRLIAAHPHWQIVDEAPPIVSQKISLKIWDAKFHEGATVYVAHCGHGATCNELARAVLKNYPEVGSPTVYCGQVPHVLDNPRPM